MDKISEALCAELQKLAPFGVGNPEPRFAVRSTRVLTPPRLLKEKHLKLKLACEQNGNGHAEGNGSKPRPAARGKRKDAA